MEGYSSEMTIVNYRGGRRRAQALATREHIVTVAEQLFAQNGYANTTIESIATAASVAVQTIYNCLGSKAAILAAVAARPTSAVDDVAAICRVIRDDATAGRPGVELVSALADWLATKNRSSASMLELFDEAAAVDQRVRKQDAQAARESQKHFALIAASVRSSGGATSMTDKQVAEAIRAVGHPRFYRETVIEGTQSHDGYRLWLDRTLRQLLL